MQRPTIVPTGDFLIRFPGFCKRLLGKNGDEGIELIFQELQPGESSLDCFWRR